MLGILRLKIDFDNKVVLDGLRGGAGSKTCQGSAKLHLPQLSDVTLEICRDREGISASTLPLLSKPCHAEPHKS